MTRRSFLGVAGVGAAGLAAATISPSMVSAQQVSVRARMTAGPFPGLRPGSAATAPRFGSYGGNWVQVPANPFGGYDFAMGYMAEGVQGIDPEAPNYPNGPLSNTSGLFEHFSLRGGVVTPPTAADSGQPLADIPSGVGGNESAQRSAEFWSRDILGQSNSAIRDDMWSAINWMRRVWGMDFDDPAADGIQFGDYPYQYPGSPDADNEYSLFSPRYAVAFDSDGAVKGFARFAPTLLAPDTAYTVIFRSGKRHPTYTGGNVVNGQATLGTAASPEWPGKVRDGGFWGGVVEAMDVLPDIQAVRRGERYFTTPDDPALPRSGATPPNPNKRAVHGGATTKNPQGTGPYWGQWWRRVAHIVGLDVDDTGLLAKHPSIDAVTDIRTAANSDLVIPGTDMPARPAARTRWPIGFWPRNTDFFWGNYNLNFGTLASEKITLHYQSEVPTDFRPSDGVPEAFLCDLCPNPGSAEITSRGDMDSGPGIMLFDSTGEVS
ncbi:MAG: twin-arginine translocation signal domain-containing protein, partial [Acidimicrobiales bacterium]